jgi:hypothetical protein
MPLRIIDPPRCRQWCTACNIPWLNPTLSLRHAYLFVQPARGTVQVGLPILQGASLECCTVTALHDTSSTPQEVPCAVPYLVCALKLPCG